MKRQAYDQYGREIPVALYPGDYVREIPDEDDRVVKLTSALKACVDHIMQNTCFHESVHRGGLIWTICDDCGSKWADDEGGFKERDYPKCVSEAWKVMDTGKVDLAPTSEIDALKAKIAELEKLTVHLPPGWVLVPERLTETQHWRMIAAAHNQLVNYHCIGSNTPPTAQSAARAVEAAWEAMLSYLPKAPGGIATPNKKFGDE